MTNELFPHQRAAVDLMHDGCVLAGNVGSGKSLAALAYYVEKICGGTLDRSSPMRTPTDLLIITSAKKRDSLDWFSEGLHFGLSEDPELCYGNVKITVDSWQNIHKYKDIENQFIIYDEQHLVGTGVWVKSFLKMAKHNRWIVLSATPADSWMDYAPILVARGYYRNRTDFIDQHVLWHHNGRYRTIRGYFGQRHLERLRSEILVPMPYERHTQRHLVTWPTTFDRDAFDLVWKRRWHVYENRPIIDVSEKYRVGRKVVNSDSSRLDAIIELSHKHPRLIIFYTHNYELELLQTLMTTIDIPMAEWNGHRHEEIPETERWIYLCQYQAASEAWNCTSTDTIVYFSLTYSHKLFEQSQGRIDRLDSPFTDLYYYILMSDSTIDKLIWKALINKRNFHESRNVKFVPEKELLSKE
jgi:superfamily II DNA or RNA helicase